MSDAIDLDGEPTAEGSLYAEGSDLGYVESSDAILSADGVVTAQWQEDSEPSGHNAMTGWPGTQ